MDRGSTAAEPALVVSGWAPLVNEAQLDWAQSNFEKSEAEFQKSIAAADAKDARQARWSHLYLGELYASEHKNDQAESELKLTIRDDDPGSTTVLQKFYHRIGNTAEDGKMIELGKKWQEAAKAKDENRAPVDFGPFMAICNQPQELAG